MPPPRCSDQSCRWCGGGGHADRGRRRAGDLAAAGAHRALHTLAPAKTANQPSVAPRATAARCGHHEDLPGPSACQVELGRRGPRRSRVAAERARQTGCAANGQLMLEQQLMPDLIISSDTTRARLTAEARPTRPGTRARSCSNGGLSRQPDGDRRSSASGSTPSSKR